MSGSQYWKQTGICNSGFPLCNALRSRASSICIFTGMWEVHLPKQTSVFCALSRMGEESVQSTEDRRVNTENSQTPAYFSFIRQLLCWFVAALHAQMAC